MKYAYMAALAGALVGLAGCASAPTVVVNEPVGPGPVAGSPGQGEGSLVIYSARLPANVDVNTEEWLWDNDFGKNEFMSEPAHSSYTIYARNGEVVRHVRNARDMDDVLPTVVALPAGSYTVKAVAVNCDSSLVQVLMTVAIKPGQTTMAHLEGGWNPGGPAEGTELAKLPCGRPIGWRAPESGFAGNAPSSQAN